MQTTKINLFSVQSLLKQNAKGIQVVGYTTRPGFSNGLFLTHKHEHVLGKYIGFTV